MHDTGEHLLRLLYIIQVNISESISPNSEVLNLSATDADEDRRLLYTIHTAMNINSTDYFKIDSSAGTLSIAKPIDREAIHQHVLTVMVKDQGGGKLRDVSCLMVGFTSM